MTYQAKPTFPRELGSETRGETHAVDFRNRFICYVGPINAFKKCSPIRSKRPDDSVEQGPVRVASGDVAALEISQ